VEHLFLPSCHATDQVPMKLCFIGFIEATRFVPILVQHMDVELGIYFFHPAEREGDVVM
jgi:hypothetical protein